MRHKSVLFSAFLILMIAAGCWHPGFLRKTEESSWYQMRLLDAQLYNSKFAHLEKHDRKEIWVIEIESVEDLQIWASSQKCLYAHNINEISKINNDEYNHKGYLSQIRDCVPPSRNGLAHANATRDAGLAEELFWTVLADIKEKYPQFISGSRHYPGMPWRFKRAIHVVDSTTIQLIAKCMNWAKHSQQKAAAKMHLDLDLKSFLPNFAIVNRAKDSDPKMAWMLCAPIRAGEIVVFDKAYVDFEHLHHLHCRGITWVTRAKDNMCFEVMGQQLSEEEIQQAQHMYESGIFMGQQPIVLSDCKIKLTSENTFGKYPDELRMITACVLQDGKPVIMRFITNHFEWSAYSICDLYLARWGIEVFFKEIKQTLQLADFLGTSENAIKWQIWIALLTYLLLRLVAWLGGWKRSFRRFFTLVKGVLWSQRSLRALITIIDKTEERGTSPPIKLSAIQMQFDFGNI